MRSLLLAALSIVPALAIGTLSPALAAGSSSPALAAGFFYPDLGARARSAAGPPAPRARAISPRWR